MSTRGASQGKKNKIKPRKCPISVNSNHTHLILHFVIKKGGEYMSNCLVQHLANTVVPCSSAQTRYCMFSLTTHIITNEIWKLSFCIFYGYHDLYLLSYQSQKQNKATLPFIAISKYTETFSGGDDFEVTLSNQ